MFCSSYLFASPAAEKQRVHQWFTIFDVFTAVTRTSSLAFLPTLTLGGWEPQVQMKLTPSTFSQHIITMHNQGGCNKKASPSKKTALVPKTLVTEEEVSARTITLGRAMKACSLRNRPQTGFLRTKSLL